MGLMVLGMGSYWSRLIIKFMSQYATDLGMPMGVRLSENLNSLI